MAEILVGKGTNEVRLKSKMANRHGLIAGATGTGKTVTLQRLAQGFSELGVPVFMADVKGDLSGMAKAGAANDRIKERMTRLGYEMPEFRAVPVQFWDVWGEQGTNLRTTISEMGPMLLGRLLALNDTQTGVLSAAFKYADDKGMLLLDLKDLQQLMIYLSGHTDELRAEYGNISPASLGTIQRNLLSLEEQGGEKLFGEPALQLSDLARTEGGKGVVNIIAADKLLLSPLTYSTLLLWLLSELFEQLPEVGDQDLPKLVFFFDEAHLLFRDTPKALVDKVEQLVRLIRSKGVGVYFVTQNPLDIPELIVAQLGNRVQHALRAFTEKDQKAVRAVADNFRQDKSFDVQDAVMTMGVGEALVSFLAPDGTPEFVQRALILPPESQIGMITPEERHAVMAKSPYQSYLQTLDRESAYEILTAQGQQDQAAVQNQQQAEGDAKAAAAQVKIDAAQAKADAKAAAEAEKAAAKRNAAIASVATSVVRSIGVQLSGSLVRGLMGTIFGGRKR
jgi:DNA helicase HerA-like ATPase